VAVIIKYIKGICGESKKVSSRLFKRHPSLLRYPGGKYYALGILRPFWLSVDHDEYREPMVGGGSVFFSKNKSQYNWLNDVDDELMTTYRVIANDELRPRLIQLVTSEIASKERWQEVSNLNPKSDIEVAYKYFYMNRTSFSGKMVSSAWGYRPKRSLPPERWHERIIPAGTKLKEVTLTDMDFELVINAPARGLRTLVYIDPPYFAPPIRKHYRYGFDSNDHVRLAECLKATKHKFFLTYDDVPEVRRLYSWANVYEAKFFYRVDNSRVRNNSRQLGFELIIANYELPNQLNLWRGNGEGG
jgi:DNA adenine methylase